MYPVQAFMAMLKREEGQDFSEYALLLALIAVGVITLGAITGVAPAIDGLFTSVVTAL